MQLLFLQSWVADNIIKAVCWTLIHSLWQGLLLAVAAGMLILLTRKSVAALRYNLLATLFFIFMGVVVFTFVYELGTTAPLHHIAMETPATPSAATDYLPLPEAARTAAAPAENYIDRFTGYFNQHASLFVACWFLIFLAKAVKLIGGLGYIQRIKHHKVHAPEAFWVARAEALAYTLGVTIRVRLLESELVKVPLTAGFLKPVILIPAGLMANLPPEQVEAILLHELAHIRRRDFMVNLAQSLAEILFFFNPAVRWLSSLLREEREHCCDDIAIAATKSRRGYVQALVSFQEYQLTNTPAYTLAFPGRKNQLLNRVKRIINNSNKTLSGAEKSFLALCCCLIGLLTLVIARPVQAGATVQSPLFALSKVATPQPGHSADQRRDKKKNSTAALPPATGQQRIAPIKTNGALVPASTLPHYTSLTRAHEPLTALVGNDYSQPYTANPGTTIKDTLPVLQKSGSVLTGTITHTKENRQYKISIENNMVTGLVVDGVKVPDDQLIAYRDLISAIFSEMQTTADQAYNKRLKETAAPVPVETGKERADGEATAMNPKNHQRNAARAEERKLHRMHRSRLFQLSQHEYLPKNDSLHKKGIAYTIIADLLQEGIITQTTTLSFSLTKDEFIVNGQQQPVALHQKFKDKYVKNPANTYSFSKNGNVTDSRIVQENK